jgi:hypothetical protein
MSHFTRVKEARVTSVEAFIKACAELGMTIVKRTGAVVRPWDRNDASIKVDVFCGYPEDNKFDACSTPKSQYGIGLQKNDDGSYDMVSDWALTGYCLPREILKGIEHAGQFPQKDQPGQARVACDELRGLTKGLVTKHTIASKYAAQGFMVQETKLDDGSIKLRLSR